MEAKIVYFPEPGPQNTEEVLRIANNRAKELGIKTIVVASTRGQTGARATEVFSGIKLVVVSQITGFEGPNTQQMTPENRKKIESKGETILTTAHIFGGLAASMRIKFGMYLFEEVVSNTLRLFGQGTKVACEVAIMAADAGLARTDEDIIAIAGTNQGADTALLLRPVTSREFFDLKIKEILCKPHF